MDGPKHADKSMNQGCALGKVNAAYPIYVYIVAETKEFIMDLIQEIMKQAGVNETQAKGGLGILLKVAQDKLSGADFSSISSAIPNVDSLIKQIPAASGAAGLLGGLAKSFGSKDLGGLAPLAGSLSALKLDKNTLAKFLPVVLEFLKSKGQGGLADKIAGFLPT